MDQELNQKIDAFIEANKEQLLDDIAALVAINSVQSEPAEGAPFGAGSRAALDKTLELAEKMGLATRNCEGYIGYAELPGADPDKYLATICHVDVVPAGEGWSASPFEMRRQDGWILGRGVLDDKGPMVVTLYALKFLKELGVSLGQYIKDRRMEKACHALVETRMAVSRIAGMVGYDNYSYFIKLFREQFGMTPVEYRKAHATRP